MSDPLAPIQIDTRLRLGPALVRLRLRGASGPLLNEDDLARRWGPFILPGDPDEDDVDEDIAVDLVSTEGPWPRTGRLITDNTLTARQREGQWRLSRADVDVALTPSILMAEGEIAPHLPAVEECVRFLMWLFLTGAGRSGLLLHAATTTQGGLAFCFPAYGGTGKSTLASLTPGDGALSDELSLLTLEGGQWRAWPCPFWNWPRQLSPEVDTSRSYPLTSLSFLRQSPATRWSPLRADDALTQLMEQAVAFDAFPVASNRTFNLAADLIEALRGQGRVGQLHLLKGDDPYAILRPDQGPA